MNVPWHAIQKRYDELVEQLALPTIDMGKRQKIQRELSHLTSLLQKHRDVATARGQVESIQNQLQSLDDESMRELYEDEKVQLEARLQESENELQRLVVPPDEYADRGVFLEIRAGTGGQEAALFAGDLMNMYMAYAHRKQWKVAVESASSTVLGGYRDVVLHIKGPGAYGHLKFESGVHRVQRVPATETSGRVHTSTATVAVLPEADDVEVAINPADLRIDTFRAGGAGGQHVNVTDSAVRITHVPTGISVSCQDERSQHKNKAKAMKILQARILAAQMEAHQETMRKERKQQIGGGLRSEKVRTYNFPQNRVTDHNADVTLKKLDIVVTQGDLDEIIDALREREHEQRMYDFLSTYLS